MQSMLRIFLLPVLLAPGVRHDVRFELGSYSRMQEVANSTTTTVDALVVIDVQHCFTNGITTQGHGLQRVTTHRKANDHGLQSILGDAAWKEKVVKYVVEAFNDGKPIVLLQDFHVNAHVSFITGGGNESKWNALDNIRPRTMTKNDFMYSNSVGQVSIFESDFPASLQYGADVFPSHCVQGTGEAKLIDGLCEKVGGVYDQTTFACNVDAEKYPNVKVVQKGTNKNIDSFGGVYDNRMGYITELKGFITKDLAKRSSWGVLEWLNDMSVTNVEAIGIADDYCVKTTALDLADSAKAELAGTQAIPHVKINPEYTYGIVAHLRNREDVGHGVPVLYKNLMGELENKVGVM